MRIVCPICAAAYEVPAPALAACRTLRCARCSADFGVDAAAATAAAPAAARKEPVRPLPAAEPSAVPADRAARLSPTLAASPAGHAAQGAVLAGWLLSLAVLAAAAWGALAWRQSVMRAWPASTRLYAALGYPGQSGLTVPASAGAVRHP